MPSVMIVEDDYFLAKQLAADVRAAGGDVLGPVPRVADALVLLERGGRPDLVVLDVHLMDEMSYPVAADAKRRLIPVVFLTCNDPRLIEPAHRDVPVYSKPIQPHEIERLLKHALDPSSLQGRKALALRR